MGVIIESLRDARRDLLLETRREEFKFYLLCKLGSSPLLKKLFNLKDFFFFYFI